MLKLLRFGQLWLVLAGLLLAVASCKKKEEPVPEDVSGTFDATFSPATSIRSVIATAAGTSNGFMAGSPDATGYVKSTSIAPGNYVLTFEPAAGYDAPAARNITITAKSNLALGTIQVSPTVPPNTYVLYPVQGQSGWTSNVSGSTLLTATQAVTTGNVTYYNGNPSSLTLKAIYQSGNLAETVELFVPGFGSTPGQYQLNYTSGGGYGTYLRTTGGATTYSLSSKVSNIQGTVTITGYNQTTRTITGTYGFNLFSINNNIGTAVGTVTNGAFTVTY